MKKQTPELEAMAREINLRAAEFEARLSLLGATNRRMKELGGDGIDVGAELRSCLKNRTGGDAGHEFEQWVNDRVA